MRRRGVQAEVLVDQLNRPGGWYGARLQGGWRVKVRDKDATVCLSQAADLCARSTVFGATSKITSSLRLRVKVTPPKVRLLSD